MIELGYAMSSEEHSPKDLIRHAQRAEEIGFTFALISDHFHPWVDRQGQSPFIWSVLGGIANATERITFGTGVTCPTIRYNPPIIAQAAATMAAMMPDRFFLGVGTGENLNEHILGDRWPAADVRLEMLEEAVDIIRLLWDGGTQSYYGAFFTVENARIYTLPEKLPPIVMAAGGVQSADTAGRIADGLVSTAPDSDLVQTFESAGGSGKPRYGQMTVCWAESEEKAKRTATEYWPIAAFKGEVNQELPLPAHFEQLASMVREEDVAERIACGPDPEKHLSLIKKYADAGYDHIYVHQVGPDQEGFFRFYEKEILSTFPRK